MKDGERVGEREREREKESEGEREGEREIEREGERRVDAQEEQLAFIENQYREVDERTKERGKHGCREIRMKAWTEAGRNSSCK